MVFLNDSGIIAGILTSGTLNVTGSIFLTLLFILLFLILIGIFFGIPLEFIAILIIPICIGTGAYYSIFLAPFGIILIYLSIIVAKNWLLNK